MQQHHGRRVVALTLLLALTGCGAVLAGVSPGARPGSGALGWWALVPAFALAELVAVPLMPGRRRRPGAHARDSAPLALALTAAPLVLGLALATPVELFVARVLGVTLVAVAWRDRPALRLGLDAALVAAGTGAAQAVVSALASSPDDVPGPVGPSAVGWVGWAVAALLGVCVAGLLDTSVLVLVAGWYEGRIPSVDAALLLLVSVAGSVVAGGLGLLGVSAARGADVGLPLALLCGAGLILQRARVALRERQRRLRQLHDLSDALLAASASDDVVGLVLARSLEIIGARYAEATLDAADGAPARTWTLRAGGVVRGPLPAPADVTADPADDAEGTEGTAADQRVRVVLGRTPAERDLLAARGVDEAVVVPLRGPEGRVGTLLVGDRTASSAVTVTASTGADTRLLETVANHASVALRNGNLVRRLHDEARRDELTGLPNRLQLREHLDAAAAGCVDGGPPCVTIVLDFDGFKAVNDTLGHPAGDELLRVLARRLAVAAGDDALVARMGGDEFAVLSTRCAGPAEAEQLADRMLGVFVEPVHVAGARLRLGGSLGVALGPHHGTTGSDLLRNADIAMYAAKAAGGGRRTFTADLVELTTEGLTLATDLRDALDHDEISVAVQPLVELATDRLHSVEVLARWHHPELGEVPPEQFFAAAERSGQLAALSSCILDRALALARGWADGGLRVRVAVNLAGRSLADVTLPEQVGAALARHGVAADRLSLEITERGVIGEPQQATATLERLRAMGVHLSVDDFGTGYSSLTYLSRLPVDQVKIDHSFVSQLDSSARDRAIVRSMIDLGRNLGLEVVAEGVMTEAVRATLQDLGCPLGQGYLFARPLDPADLPGYLAGLAARGEARAGDAADAAGPVDPAGASPVRIAGPRRRSAPAGAPLP